MKQALKPLWEVILTLVVVFCFTTLVLWLAGAPPLKAYYYIFKGAFGSWSKVGHVLKAWVPLTLCAAGLLYTFRINLWNIGVEGQMIMGAVLATLVLRWGTDAGAPVLVIAGALTAGMIGGGIWALFAGILKTRGGINEIFAGLGLNFVAQGMVLWLIFGPWKRPGIASMSGTELLPHDLWLSTATPLRITPTGIVITVAVVVLTALLLRYSTIGLRLRAIGNNPDAVILYGHRPGRYMLMAMLLAGGFAGMAGTLQVTGVYHRLIPAISSGYGYLALLVVMLANYNSWVSPVIAFVFACLNVGSIQLPMVLKIDSSLSGVIQGALVLATLAVHAWRSSRPRT
ncbi:MAG: ABC transporter permease [Deltaproteobacteria bacterium]|nr:MAG: ABC transporter permease [Deltaproteobacteria bacterium]